MKKKLAPYVGIAAFLIIIGLNFVPQEIYPDGTSSKGLMFIGIIVVLSCVVAYFRAD